MAEEVAESFNGAQLWFGKEVTGLVEWSGKPASRDPLAAYFGLQSVAVKASRFAVIREPMDTSEIYWRKKTLSGKLRFLSGHFGGA